MRSRKLWLGAVYLMLMLFLVVGFMPVSLSNYTVEAASLDDDLNNSSSDASSGDEDPSRYDNGVSDLFKNKEPMTKEQLDVSAEKLSPITNMFGYLMGAGVTLAMGAIFVITVADLLYIGVPPLRGLLYKGDQQQAQMGGGYGRYGGGMQQSPTGHKFQLISDEAVQCSLLFGNNQTQASGGGYGGGYGGYGGAGMQTGQQQEATTKSVIATYFKKRVVFIILFAVCATILTTSLFLNTGFNLARWFTKLMMMVNNAIPK